jgi:predicted nucleic acid-binding protein
VKLDAEVFLDSAYLIALGVPADQHHAQAVELFQAISAARIRIVTNRAVLLEVGSSLSKSVFVRQPSICWTKCKNHRS